MGVIGLGADRHERPHKPVLLLAVLDLIANGTATPNKIRWSQETADETRGRISAFRRKILEIYDCQCAACGLRIKMPEVNDLTFVDAAHLIPFEVEPNDNPTNGIALCKNHHWAMDRFLIAPCPADDGTGVWRASRVLKGRRSQGEEELLALDGEPVLPPAEEAFKPDLRSLKRRYERLVA